MNLDTKDDYVRERQLEMMRINEKFALRFDQLYKTVQEMQTANDLYLKELQDKHENAVKTQASFHEQVMGKLNDTIVDIHD